MITVDQFMAALRLQESGGDYEAVNPDTGAFGAYQILPANWGSWSREAGLGFDAAKTADNQDRVARFKLSQLFGRYGAWEDVAAVWYSGSPRDPATLDRPQGGGRYPTIRQYIEQVMGRVVVMADFRFTAPPVEGAVINGTFRQVYDLGNGRYEHPGLDFWKDGIYGAPIFWTGNKPAPVRWRNNIPESDRFWGDGSLGICAIIGPVDGLWFVAAHMTLASDEPDSNPLKVADPGDLLGWVGDTGVTTGAHVHLGASKEPVAAGGLPGFAPMRQLQDGISRITNPNLLDPAAYFVEAPLPSPNLTWEDALRGTFGTPERLQMLLSGGFAPVERRLDVLERSGDSVVRSALKNLGGQFE